MEPSGRGGEKAEKKAQAAIFILADWGVSGKLKKGMEKPGRIHHRGRRNRKKSKDSISFTISVRRRGGESSSIASEKRKVTKQYQGFLSPPGRGNRRQGTSLLLESRKNPAGRPAWRGIWGLEGGWRQQTKAVVALPTTPVKKRPRRTRAGKGRGDGGQLDPPLGAGPEAGERPSRGGPSPSTYQGEKHEGGGEILSVK